MILWGSTRISAVKWGSTTCTQVKWGSTVVFPGTITGLATRSLYTYGTFNTISYSSGTNPSGSTTSIYGKSYPLFSGSTSGYGVVWYRSSALYNLSLYKKVTVTFTSRSNLNSSYTPYTIVLFWTGTGAINSSTYNTGTTQIYRDYDGTTSTSKTVTQSISYSGEYYIGIEIYASYSKYAANQYIEVTVTDIQLLSA